jgi:ABC-type ATPase involved in cell division
MKLFRSNLIRLTRPPLPAQVKDDPVHVRIRDVHKTYGDHHVLNGVSLDIYRGKTNLIIGPSGSGKTVLMRQLIRLEKPDSGALLVNGVDFAKLQGLNLAAMRRTFGMVFQMSALFDSMTAFDNVAFPLREHTDLSREEVRDRVMDRVSVLGVSAAAHKLPAGIATHRAPGDRRVHTSIANQLRVVLSVAVAVAVSASASAVVSAQPCGGRGTSALRGATLRPLS